MIYLASLDHPHGEVSVEQTQPTHLAEIFLASGHSMASARPEISIEVAFLDFIAPILQRFRTCRFPALGWENVRKCLKFEVFHRNI
jgi:hypothetical protein